MTKFTQCEQCNLEIADGKCKFAVYKRVIDGKVSIFCCEQCANRYEKKKQKRDC